MNRKPVHTNQFWFRLVRFFLSNRQNLFLFFWAFGAEQHQHVFLDKQFHILVHML